MSILPNGDILVRPASTDGKRGDREKTNRPVNPPIVGNGTIPPASGDTEQCLRVESIDVIAEQFTFTCVLEREVPVAPHALANDFHVTVRPIALKAMAGPVESSNSSPSIVPSHRTWGKRWFRPSQTR